MHCAILNYELQTDTEVVHGGCILYIVCSCCSCGRCIQERVLTFPHAVLPFSVRTQRYHSCSRRLLLCGERLMKHVQSSTSTENNLPIYRKQHLQLYQMHPAIWRVSNSTSGSQYMPASHRLHLSVSPDSVSLLDHTWRAWWRAGCRTLYCYTRATTIVLHSLIPNIIVDSLCQSRETTGRFPQ